MVELMGILLSLFKDIHASKDTTLDRQELLLNNFFNMGFAFSFHNFENTLDRIITHHIKLAARKENLY
jgi:hypothetical protein